MNEIDGDPGNWISSVQVFPYLVKENSKNDLGTSGINEMDCYD